MNGAGGKAGGRARGGALADLKGTAVIAASEFREDTARGGAAREGGRGGAGGQGGAGGAGGFGEQLTTGGAGGNGGNGGNGGKGGTALPGGEAIGGAIWTAAPPFSGSGVTFASGGQANLVTGGAGVATAPEGGLGGNGGAGGPGGSGGATGASGMGGTPGAVGAAGKTSGAGSATDPNSN
jgi:hypothetical protein